MIKKIISIVLILLFIGSVAADDSELRTQTSMNATELPTENRLGVMAESGVRGAADGVCVLSIDSTTESKLDIKCGVEEAEQTGFLEATLESSGDRSRYSPESVAVVRDSDRCPGSRVCYELQSGSIDVGVVNDPPTTRGSPIYEGSTTHGTNPLYKSDRMSNTMSVVTYGSYKSIKALKKGDRISTTSADNEEDLNSGRSDLFLENVQGDMDFRTVTLNQRDTDPSNDCNDEDGEVHPGKCGEGVPVDLDSDADDLPDLEVVPASNNSFTWTISNKSVLRATLNDAQVGETEITFVQVEGSDRQSMNKAELIEAMASHAGLSKADSKKALEGFIDTTVQVAVRDPECCFDYNADTDLSSSTGSIDKATPAGDLVVSNFTDPNDRPSTRDYDASSPKLAEALAEKDARIEQLERRIAELEADGNISASSTSSEQGNDRVVRKKPGRTVTGEDTDSDGDGISDVEETEDLENNGNSSAEDRRPGFVNRLLGSIFG